MRSFVKIKPTRIGDITLLFTDISKSRPCHKFLTSQLCVLTQFAKIKFSRKFQNNSIELLSFTAFLVNSDIHCIS